jgi:hypothetical protein
MCAVCGLVEPGGGELELKVGECLDAVGRGAGPVHRFSATSAVSSTSGGSVVSANAAASATAAPDRAVQRLGHELVVVRRR